MKVLKINLGSNLFEINFIFSKILFEIFENIKFLESSKNAIIFLILGWGVRGKKLWGNEQKRTADPD